MHFHFTSRLSSYILLFYIGTFSANIFSQQQKDSLDQYSFDELHTKFKKVLRQNTDIAKAYAKKTLEIAENNNNDEKKVLALINLATAYNVANESELATHYIDRAISVAEDSFKGKELEARAIFTKGIFYYQKSDYESAFECYTKAYNFYKNLTKDVFYHSISHNIANIKNALGDYSGALEAFQTNYKNYINTPKPQRKSKFSSSFYVNTLIALNDTYIKLSTIELAQKSKLLDSASFYNKIGYEETKRMQDEANVYFHTQRGIISYEREKFKLAIHELDKSIHKIATSHYKNLFTSAYYYKAMSFKKLQQIDSAIVYFEKMDSVSIKNDINYPLLQSGYFELAEIFKKRKDHTSAYKYLGLYLENDQINERITGTVRKDIHEKYDLDRLKTEIESLNETQYKSVWVISLLIISLGLFSLFYWKQKLKNKASFEKLLMQLEEKKTQNTPIEKTKKSVTIDDEKVIQVLKALEKFEEKEWFRNKNCDLAFVAKKARINKTYLSKIIHEHKHEKFIDYIRNLRINYALKRLKDDPVFRSYDIKSIAEESGFKSSDMFSRAFVKNTGIYPSYYIKNISKISSSSPM